jgi:hypothetical protein
MNGWIIIEPRDSIDDGVLVYVRGVIEPKRSDTDIGACANLISYVDLRRGIGPDAGVIYGSHFADIGLPLLRVKEKYIADITAWRDKYLLPTQGASGSPAAT